MASNGHAAGIGGAVGDQCPVACLVRRRQQALVSANGELHRPRRPVAYDLDQAVSTRIIHFGVDQPDQAWPSPWCSGSIRVRVNMVAPRSTCPAHRMPLGRGTPPTMTHSRHALVLRNRCRATRTSAVTIEQNPGNHTDCFVAAPPGRLQEQAPPPARLATKDVLPSSLSSVALTPHMIRSRSP